MTSWLEPFGDVSPEFTVEQVEEIRHGAPQWDACDRCSLGVQDASNPHSRGQCGCDCHGVGPHHHHHDYIETLYVQDRSGCEACREMDARRADDWHWPYRWVYDWHPPCRCSSAGAGVSTPEGDEE